jgi:predicted MFS family arabinose efflux permease
MTALTIPVPAAVPARPRLLTGPLVRVFVADLGGLTGFYLLLSVVPQYAGSGGVGAGLTTGVLMAATVAGELAVPRLVARYGYRLVLAAGLLLLGVPALLLPVSSALPAVLAVSALRGLGLAVLFVACGSLAAALVPAERRGEGLGVFGVVAGLPAVVAMPLGVWLLDRFGFVPVFLAGGLVALAGLAVLSGIPGRRPADDGDAMGIVSGLRAPALRRPSVIFAATAMGAGVVATFLPAAVPHGDLAAGALLAHAVAATAARWWAGRLGDRHGAARLLVPGAVLSVAGLALLVAVGSPAAMFGGAVVFGAGFGMVQNASLAMLLDRVAPADYDTVTAVWSVAYDTGFGLGAVGFGVLAAGAGYPLGFAFMALVVVAAVLTTRPRRSG